MLVKVQRSRSESLRTLRGLAMRKKKLGLKFPDAEENGAMSRKAGGHGPTGPFQRQSSEGHRKAAVTQRRDKCER